MEWSGREVVWMVSDSLKALKTMWGFIAWSAVTLEAQKGPVDDSCQDVFMTTQDFISEVSRTFHETHQITTKPMEPVFNQYASQ